MNKTKEAIIEAGLKGEEFLGGWKLAYLLGVEKLDFKYLEYADILEAHMQQNEKTICFIYIRHDENFVVTVSTYKNHYGIKAGCKSIYEALDAANQWWDQNKNSIKWEE
jgi:hypothetical protein